MSNTDRIRAYYNLHRKCFSVQDYQTGLVSEHTYQLFVTNAMFVVRKSGNERVKQEGKKNVHAFVNGIRHDKWSDTNPLGDDKSNDTKGKPVIINVPNNISARGLEKVDFDFLRKKRKQIENKKKLLAI